MAEEEKWADFNPLTSGSAAAPPETPAPPRGWSGALMDTGLELGKTVLGVGQQVHGVREAIATAIDPRGAAATQARADIDALGDARTALEGYKTPRGQDLTRHPESFTESPGKYIVNTAVGMAPYVPLAIATGGVGGAAAFGVLGFGQVRSDMRENLRNSSPEQLATNPEYVNFRDQGMTHEQAIEEVYLQATDPRKLQTYVDAAPNVIGQVATGGAGGAFIRNLTHGATRKYTSEIVQKVMDKANTNWGTRRLTGAGIGAGAGAVAGGGQELSRQWSEQTAGIQTTPTDWSKVGDSAAEMATMFGALGTVGYRGVAKPKVPAIGTDVEAAALQAQGYGAPGKAARAPPKPATAMEPGDVGLSEYGTYGGGGPGGVGTGPLPPPGGRPGYGAPEMHPADVGRTEYGTTGTWRRPDSTAPPGAEPPPTAPSAGAAPVPMQAGDLGYEYGMPGPAAAPPTPGHPAVHGDIYRGMAPPEGSAPAPFGMEPPEASRPAAPTRGRRGAAAPVEPIAPVGPGIMRGGAERGEGIVEGAVPVAGKAVEAPPPARPPNISRDARYVGDTYDGRQIWVGGDGRRQYQDPATTARHTEPKAKSGDLNFRTVDEIPPAHRVTPETIEQDKAQLAALMETKSPGMRASMARVLEQAPTPGLHSFTKIGQTMLGPLRHKFDQLLHHDREGTINAIRGDAAKAKVAERAVPKEAPAPEVPPVEFGTPGEVPRTEVPYDPYADSPDFGGEALYAPKGYEPGKPSGAKAEPARPADLGLKKGDRYKKEYRLRMQKQAGHPMTLPEQEVSRQQGGKTTTKRETLTLSAGLERIKQRLEMKRAERKAVAEKIRSATIEKHQPVREYPAVSRIAVVDKGRIGDRSEAMRKQRREWKQQTETEMADVLQQRREQILEQAQDTLKDMELREQTGRGLEEFRAWEDKVRRGETAKLPDFWANRDRLEADTVNAIRIELEDHNRKADRDRKSVQAESEFRIRNLIAKDVLKKTRVSVDHLNKLLTGVALDADGNYITKSGEARAKRWKAGTDEPLRDKELAEYHAKIERYESAMEEWENDGGETSGRPQPSFPKAPKGQALNPLFEPFLNLPTNELKQVAFAFVAEARDRIAAANEKFTQASANQWEEWGRKWGIGKEVGWDRRGDTGTFYNQLVDDKRFIAAVAKYSGTAKKVSKKTDAGNRKMLQAIVLNHWISQKAALTGDVHKMKAAYQERVAVLREEMMEKYNLLSTETFAGNAKMQEAVEAERKKIQEVFDDDAATIASAAGAEKFSSITEPKTDILQRLDEATEVARGELYTRDPTDPDIKKGLRTLLRGDDIPDTALRISSDYVSRDVQEQWRRHDVNYRRQHGNSIKTTALDKRMVALHGEGWRTMDPDTRAQVEGERLLRREYGAETMPRGGTVEPGGKMLPGDVVRGLDEQAAFVTDGKPLSPEGRAYRVNELMERADQILDEIEANPRKASDPKLQDELQFLEDEVRQHYEDAVPEARGKEFGLGKVLESGSDLSNKANLPNGAYVRRVSDYLKEGRRGIRSGLDRVGGRLRNHMLSVAQRAIGDMEVVALTSEQMALALDEKNLHHDTPAFYDPNSHRVFASQRVLHSADRDRVLGHEFAHPLTLRAAEMFPGIRRNLEKIHQELRDAYYKPSHPAWGAVRNALESNTQALDNIHEFIGELYNDGGKVSDALYAIQTTPELRKSVHSGALGMLLEPTLRTIEKGLRDLFYNVDKKRLLNDSVVNSLHLFDQLEQSGMYTPPQRKGPALPFTPPASSMSTRSLAVPDTMEGAVSKAGEVWRDTKFRLQRMGLTGAFLKTHTFVDLRRRAEEGMQAVVRGVEDVWSKIETTSRNIFRDSGAEDIAFKIADEMRMPPKVFQKLQDYVSQENHWKVSGEDNLHEGKNAWVSRDSPYHQHYRDRHAELRARYNELTDSQKELRRRMLDYYDSTHGKILRGNLTRLIHLRDMVPGNDGATIEALVKHITKEDLSAAEKRRLETIPGYESEIDLTVKTPEHVAFRKNVTELRSNPLFRKVEGVWYPSKRRGNYVVEGRYDLAPVAERYGGRKVDDKGNIFEFDDDANAQKFYRDIVGSDAYGGIHHEGTTQVVYKADEHGRPVLDAEGKPVYETEYSERTSRVGEEGTPGFKETTTGAERRVSAKAAAAEGGTNTVTRHRVEFNNLLLEFYENPRHAYERHAELQGESNLKLTGVEPKRQTAGTYLDPKKASRVYETLMNSLERSKAWENMDATTRKMATRDLEEAAVQHIMSVSARSTRIPRKYALGADKSMLQDFNDYSRNSSMTLAEQEHRPALSASLKTMDDYVGDNRMWTAGGGDISGAELRRKLQHEVHERLFTRPNELTHGFWTDKLARILQISYMDKLLSPGFVVLNASEPWVIGMPLLSGHHGFGGSMAEIGRAYAALGFHGMWGKGVANAWKAGAEGIRAKFEDNHTLLTERIKNEADGAELVAMHNYGAERGYFDRDAGMELAQRADPSGNKVERGLDYVDNISRQVNTQIENVNRSVMAIAAYRLARKKGWSAEKSMQHAFDMVHDTSGNYGHWNTPAMFNDPRLKFALQFRRYGARITANYIRMFAQSFGDYPPEVKAVARKQLGVTLGTQMILAGQLGLPTEPIKLALLATSPITGFGPDEAEIWAREAMANATGDPQLAEGIMRGFPRAYLDLGIGTRLGHDSLWSHGTAGKKPDNWYSTAGHYLVGAPGGMLVDWALAGGKTADAAINAARGRTTQAGTDASDAMQLALPFKLISDTIGAARSYMGGPKTMTTAGQPVGYQPTLGQAVMEASGIRSGTQQEASDKRFALSQAKAQYAEFKNKSFQMYVRASNPAEQRSIEQAAIARSRENWPKEMWLTHSDFYKAKRRFELNQSADPSDVGVHLSKRERGLRERFDFFNV